jgi:hypothetical protein
MKKSAAFLTLLGLQMLTLPGREARATADVDRKYALDTIGTLRSWDNVDGLFADYVATAYKDYFAKQSRFRPVDLSKADAVFSSSKLPYYKAIDDAGILAQLSRSMKTQSLIRTRVRKEGPNYRFTLEWLHAPSMDVLGTETFTLTDIAGGFGDVAKPLKAALDRLFRQVPFLGMITGRDENTVTVNLGASSGIHKGDTLSIGTLDDVRKHPLLKKLVEWRVTPTGRVQVEQVEDSLAFCRMLGEEEGRHVERLQKITQITPYSEPQTAPIGRAKDDGSLSAAASADTDDEVPRLGFVRASLWTGTFSRQFSSVNGAAGLTGSSFLYGAKGEGQVWFNREFFGDIELGYGGFGYSQTDIATNVPTPASGVYGSAYTFKLDLGYSFFLSSEFFGPRGWLKVGYLVHSINLPIVPEESTAPFRTGSIFLGVGGDMPLRNNYGARLDFDFGLLNSAKETGTANGDINSAYNARLYAGGYYRYDMRLLIAVGVEIHGTGGEFNNGASLTQRSIALLPSLTYYF